MSAKDCAMIGGVHMCTDQYSGKQGLAMDAKLSILSSLVFSTTLLTNIIVLDNLEHDSNFVDLY